MKKLIPTLLFLTLGFYGFSQENENTELSSDTSSTLKATKTTGFAGTFLQLSFINGEAIPFFGGCGAAMFNENLYVGGYGIGLFNGMSLENQNPTENGFVPKSRLDIQMGGIMLGYMPWGDKKYHPIIGLDFGWGNYTLTDETTKNQFMDGTFTTLTPRVGGEADVSDWLKINVGVGYRAFSGIKNSYFESSNMSSPFVDVRLQFGWFANQY